MSLAHASEAHFPPAMERAPAVKFYSNCEQAAAAAANELRQLQNSTELGNVAAAASKIFQKFQIFPAAAQLANCTKNPQFSC